MCGRRSLWRSAAAFEARTPEVVGTVIRVSNTDGSSQAEEVVEWDPPRRLEMTHRGFVRGVGTWWFEPDAAGTRFTWSEELSLPIPILGELALWVYRPFMKRLMRSGLANLQRLIEST